MNKILSQLLYQGNDLYANFLLNSKVLKFLLAHGLIKQHITCNNNNNNDGLLNIT